MLKLHLMESHCLPVLLYATTALNFNREQLRDLNAGWNSVYRRIFGFNKWESVKLFIAGLGRLDFKSLRSYLCLKFYKAGSLSDNTVFRNVMNHYLFSTEFKEICNAYKVTNVQFLSMSVSQLKKCVFDDFLNKSL